MNEKELLNQVSLLKNIKPRQEWVVFAKSRIMGTMNEFSPSPINWVGQIGQMIMFYSRKPAFAMAAFAILLGSGFFVQIVRQSLPGDTFYGLKAATQQAQFTLALGNNQSLLYFNLAQKRLDDINTIVGQNNTQNTKQLSSAIKEFQTTSARATKEFALLVENDPKKALQASREIIELQNTKIQIEKALGTKFGEQESNDLENATKALLENEFSDLDSRTLTEQQLVLLNEAKNAFTKSDYQTALEKVWTISN